MAAWDGFDWSVCNFEGAEESFKEEWMMEGDKKEEEDGWMDGFGMMMESAFANQGNILMAAALAVTATTLI